MYVQVNDWVTRTLFADSLMTLLEYWNVHIILTYAQMLASLTDSQNS